MTELSALSKSLAVGCAIPQVVIKRRFESTAQAIVRVSTEYDTRLLVCGTRGTGFARRALIGSVAAQVLKSAYCPVMLVGKQAEASSEDRPYRVIVASDGSDPTENLLTAFTRAVSGAPPDGISVTTVQVYEPVRPPADDEVSTARSRLSAIAARLPQQFDPNAQLLLDEQRRGPAELVVRYAAESGAHCIWMATQAASWPKQAFLGSVALSVVDRASVPVVLIRAKEGE
jgi:nucleotide-binding universal stress UspA family protein